MTRPLLLSAVLAVFAACSGCPPQGDLAITTESLPPGNVDTSYAAAIATEGGSGTLKFDIASGALPLGVELDAATGDLRGTPTEFGVFQFGARVTDGTGAAAVKGLTIEVFSYPPVRIVTTEVRNAVVGGSYLAILSALDGSPPYTWSVASGALPEGIRLTEGGSLVGSAGALESQSFEVRARDTHRDEPRRQEARARFTITTFLPLSFDPPGPALPDAYANEAYSVALIASGGKAPYSFASIQGGGLPSWLTLSGAGVLSGTAPAAPSSYALSIRALDDSRTDQVALRDYTVMVRGPVVFDTTAFPDTFVGQAYSAPVMVSGGKAPLAVRVSAGALPPGLSLGGGAIAGAATAAGAFDFTLEVSDANARVATRDFRITVTNSVTVATGTLPDAYQGRPFGGALSAMGGSPPYTWALVQGSLPDGIQLSAAGAFSGSPTAIGTSAFTVEVTDMLGQQAQKSLSIEVLALPALAGAALPDGYAGEGYSVTLSATGGRTPFTYALGGGALPDGVSLSTAGAIDGTPTTPQGRSFSVTATDRNGQAASASFTIGIYAPVAVPPATLPDGYLTRSYSAQLSSTGGKAPVQWSVSSGALPDGIVLSSTGGLSGTPTATGSFAFDVRATDVNGRYATRSLSIDVFARPSLGGGALADGYLLEPYSAAIAATGGRPPFSYSVSSGSPPPGLTLGTGGLWSGTPTSAPGTSFTVTAVDFNGQAAAAVYSVAVYPLPVIATSGLPGATRGQPYSEGLLGTGGKPTVTWTVTPGALPPGLSLSTATGWAGTISGTPTAAGFYAFAATLTDANGRADTQDLSILVSAPPSDGGTDAGSDGGSGGGSDGGSDGGSFDGRFFRLANWNVEWFGDPGNGPSDEPLQQANVRAIMADAGYEIWALQEMVDGPAFDALVAGLPGYDGFMAGDSTRVAGTSTCGFGSSLCYSSGEQQVALVYRTNVARVASAKLILTTNDFSFAGRPPLQVDFILDGGTGERLTVITMHMKAQAGLDDWERRRDAGGLVESYLRANFDGGSRVAVIGDWNDDVDFSIVGGQPTPYANFNADPATFQFLTAPMSMAGIGSTISFNSFIDHQLVTSGLLPWYRPGSAQRVPFTTWIAGAGNSTSDHYPIVSRFNLGGNPPDGGP